MHKNTFMQILTQKIKTKRYQKLNPHTILGTCTLHCIIIGYINFYLIPYYLKVFYGVPYFLEKRKQLGRNAFPALIIYY